MTKVINMDLYREEYERIRRINYDTLSPFARGYFDASLWTIKAISAFGDIEEFFYRISPRSKKKMLEDCERFIAAYSHLLDEDNMERAGHMLLLTRNKYGDFFDGLGAAALLNARAKEMGPLILAFKSADQKEIIHWEVKDDVL